MRNLTTKVGLIAATGLVLFACSSDETTGDDPFASAGKSGSGTGAVTSGTGGVSSGGSAAGGAAPQGGGGAGAGTGTSGAGGGGTSGGSASSGGAGAASSGGSAAGGVGGSASTGGSATSGGSAGAAGNGASGGSSGTSGGQFDCDVKPVSPNYTPQAQKVLCYLYNQVGKHILSAQEEDNSDEGMDFVHRVSGKYPAIRAFDLNNSKAPGQCVDHAKKGGLCMIGYHMFIDGTFVKGVDIRKVIESGSQHDQFIAKLDDVVRTFQQLQAVNGVGFMRLLHEVGNGCKWFWWSESGNSGDYVALWKYAYNYIIGKGIKNALWITPHCGNANSGAWNPGKGFVDIGGSDTYKNNGDYQALTNQYKDTQNSFPGLPIALHENGPIPDPDKMKSEGAKWIMFNTWSDHFNPPVNSEDHTKAVYNHDYVITLDELPKFE